MTINMTTYNHHPMLPTCPPAKIKYQRTANDKIGRSLDCFPLSHFTSCVDYQPPITIRSWSSQEDSNYPKYKPHVPLAWFEGFRMQKTPVTSIKVRNMYLCVLIMGPKSFDHYGITDTQSV